VKVRAFTIVEVLVVMTIILVLAGLILATSSYVHNKGARSRTEAEIAAMSAALESYKADNGIYPSETSTDARTAMDPASYQAASEVLYSRLTGDANGDGQPDNGASAYLAFKTSQLGGSGGATFIKDPFGNSYGYSTVNQTDPAKGYNPTFDLWSTAGGTSTADQVAWIKNW
jgi:prepilin-type N-terminal cleavage/methylation domain-containing protein